MNPATRVEAPDDGHEGGANDYGARAFARAKLLAWIERNRSNESSAIFNTHASGWQITIPGRWNRRQRTVASHRAFHRSPQSWHIFGLLSVIRWHKITLIHRVSNENAGAAAIPGGALSPPPPNRPRPVKQNKHRRKQTLASPVHSFRQAITILCPMMCIFSEIINSGRVRQNWNCRPIVAWL